MHSNGCCNRRVRPSAPSLGLGLLIALVALPVIPHVPAAAAAAPPNGPVLSLTPPPSEIVGPGSGVDLSWAIANHTDAALRVTVEFAPSRSWPFSSPYRGMRVPPRATIHFTVPSSVPDTAAAGDVGIFTQLHVDGDSTTVASCTAALLVLSAPPAGAPLEIVSDLVRVEWSTQMRGSFTGIVEVQRNGRGWNEQHAVAVDENGRCTFEDRAVAPGSDVEYRNREWVNGLVMVSEVTKVHVPELTALSIAGLRPNPSFAAPMVAFTLAERTATRLEVYDVGGRRVWASDLGELAPGPHLQPLGPSTALPSGAYVFRIISGARSVSARGVITR